MMPTLLIIRDITLNTVKSLCDRSDLARKKALQLNQTSESLEIDDIQL